MATKTVSNASQLKAALDSANGGDTISLKSGNYGSFDFDNYKFSKFVTITSADGKNGAKFTDIDVYNSSYLRFDGIHVSAPDNGGSATKVVDIQKSHHIDFFNSEVNAKEDAVKPITGYFGIYVNGGSKNVRVEGNYVHDVQNGVAFYGTDDITVKNNTMDYIGIDSFKFSNVDGAVIEDNMGPLYQFAKSGAHEDFMQFQGAASKNVVIRGNVFMPKNIDDVQGIFLAGDGGHTNILIEQNIIYTNMANGIVVENGKNVTINENTLINAHTNSSNTTAIFASGAKITNNIYTKHKGGIEGSNLVVQHYSKNADHYIGDYFPTALMTTSGKIDLEDLIPKKGTIAAQKGAYDRLMELINGGHTTTVTPPNDNDNDNDGGSGDGGGSNNNTDDDDDGFTITSGSRILYSRLGDTKFDGTKGDVIEVSHAKKFEVDEANIEFSFEADSVSGRGGLLSKDAGGFSGGGNHFTAYVEKGVLKLRFDDDDSTVYINKSGIKAGVEYDVKVSFEPGLVTGWLNGQKIGSVKHTMNWEDNVQHIQVGAIGWSSSSKGKEFKDAFDGVISDVVIYEGPDSGLNTTSGAGGGNGDLGDMISTDWTAPKLPTTIYAVSGDTNIDGKVSNVINLKHSSMFAVSEGTIAFSFEADKVSGREGLISKDAYGFSGGGNHLTTYIQDGTLVVRFQDDNSSKVFKKSGIKKDVEYDLMLAFGEGRVDAWLDGSKIGGANFDMSWENNREYLQIGANGWSSTSRDDGFVQVFDGTISDLAIYSEAYTPSELIG